ncbi:MAG: hypothetical protein AMXMBFR47_43390 [Planctomycetota bacterium]
MSQSTLWPDFLAASTAKLRTDMAQIARCAALLTDDQAWSRPNEHCNSVANLILHLTGNVSQWICAGLGGDDIPRDRPAEFAARDVRPVRPLTDALQRTIDRAIAIISALDEAALAKRHTIQKYEVSGLLAIFHVVEHFSFHTGQIIHITKSILDVDLSLYDAHGRPLKRTAAGGQPW